MWIVQEPFTSSEALIISYHAFDWLYLSISFEDIHVLSFWSEPVTEKYDFYNTLTTGKMCMMMDGGYGWMHHGCWSVNGIKYYRHAPMFLRVQLEYSNGHTIKNLS